MTKKNSAQVYKTGLLCATVALGLGTAPLVLAQQPAEASDAEVTPLAAPRLVTAEDGGDGATMTEEQQINEINKQLRNKLAEYRQQAAIVFDGEDDSYYSPFLQKLNEIQGEYNDAQKTTATEAQAAYEKAVAAAEQNFQQQKHDMTERSKFLVNRYVEIAQESATNDDVKSRLAEFGATETERIIALPTWSEQWTETQHMSQGIWNRLAEFERDDAAVKVAAKYDEIVANNDKTQQHYAEADLEKLKQITGEIVDELKKIDTTITPGAEGTGRDGEKIQAALRRTKELLQQAEARIAAVEKSAAPETEVVSPTGETDTEENGPTEPASGTDGNGEEEVAEPGTGSAGEDGGAAAPAPSSETGGETDNGGGADTGKQPVPGGTEIAPDGSEGGNPGAVSPDEGNGEEIVPGADGGDATTNPESGEVTPEDETDVVILPPLVPEASQDQLVTQTTDKADSTKKKDQKKTALPQTADQSTGLLAMVFGALGLGALVGSRKGARNN